MRWEKVFISYDTEDKELVTRIVNSMVSVGMEPYIAPDHLAVGADLADKIIVNLKDSNCFVPILTKNSISSQWVNQEIGYAYSLRNNLGIFPLVERGLPIKGFIHRSKENIEFDLNDTDDGIYKLVSALREYINRNWAKIERIRVKCITCTNEYQIDLPSQKNIDMAISEGRLIPSICKRCRVQNNLSPKTFQVVNQVKLAF